MLARSLLLLQVCWFLAAGSADAFQPAVSDRRSFVGKLVAGTAGVVVATTHQNPARAATTDSTKQQFTGAKASMDSRQRRSSAFRGGAEAAASTHDGTDLNDAEASVAGGLLDKMGLADVPGAIDRSKDRRKAYGGAK